MKPIAYASLAVLLIVCSYTSQSADPSNRPPGVAERNWVPVSDRLGVVLAESPKAPMAVSPQVLLLEPPVGGYFMVKGRFGWIRLVVVEPAKGPGSAG
jgi:hypothetical protein